MEKSSCCSLTELPYLIIDTVLDCLPLADLKNLRQTCSVLKCIVEQHPAFYNNIRISINSDNCHLLQQSQLEEKVFTNIKVDLDSCQLDSTSFLSILNWNEASIRTIRLVGLPYKILPLGFLSLLSAVRHLEFEGSWALANFKPEAVLEPKFKAESVESLVINASTDACGFYNFNNFGEFLTLFPALRRLKLYSRFANAVQPLLYRQLVRVFLNRYNLSESIDLQDFIKNSGTRYLPICKLLCEFCCELELQFPDPSEITNRKDDFTETENNFLNSVVGLNSHAVGNNVTFPFSRLVNLSWVRLNLHKFNYPESFNPILREGVQHEPFISLKKLHLTLFNDYTLFELRKAQDICARHGRGIEELVLDLPLDSQVKVPDRDELVTSFFSVFNNLKILQIHNWFSPVWVLPQNLTKLELCNVMN